MVIKEVELKHNKFKVWSVDSESGNRYFVTYFPPAPTLPDGLLQCTCPDFTMGRPNRGINPFLNPCKHVTRTMLWVQNGTVAVDV